MAARTTTRVSSKGQVVLPKAVRERRGWEAGAELVVEERPDGVLLRPARREEPTRIEDVAGCLAPAKRKAGIEDISSVSARYVRERWGHEYDDRD